ncbi:hypothetical protein [Novosphingobium terrae]|uniref:hypothetical protein n=1 Tax=Novosphingobium terrae TaxID=2726189 RepID=UPI001F1424B4|nr:hypothetical protein [Novosphingobium terrae]
MRFDFHHGRDLIRLFSGPSRKPTAHDGGGALGSRRRRDPALRLLDAVMRLAGPESELISHAERPWASATFSGTRHTITLSFAGDPGIAAAESFIALLPDHEFHLPGRLVADAGVSEVTHLTQPRPLMVVEADLLLLNEI